MMHAEHRARAFAVAAHGEQRYGAHPYAHHLDAVAELARHFGESAVVAAYLHDTVEDTEATLAEIEQQFGPHIAACVALLTDQPGVTRQERKARTYAKLAEVSGALETARAAYRPALCEPLWSELDALLT